MRYQLTPLLVSILLASCTSSNVDQPYEVKRSYLANKDGVNVENIPSSEKANETISEQPAYRSLNSLKPSLGGRPNQQGLSELFSDKETIVFSADKVPLSDLFHSFLNELLSSNYVVDKSIRSLNTPVTLSFANPVTKRRAFELFRELLAENNVDISHNDGVFYLTSANGKNKNLEVGFGKYSESVPNSAGNIMQIVPLSFGANIALERSIREVAQVDVSSDLERGFLFLVGTREQILKSLDFISLMDVQASRGKYISLLRLTYLAPEEFAKKAQSLMSAEGIPNVSIGLQNSSNVILVPIEHNGTLAVFSSQQQLVDRVRFWASELDVAGDSSDKKYYIYNPRFARAADLGASLQPLIAPGRTSQTGNQQRDTQTSGLGQDSSSTAIGTNSTTSGRQRSSSGGVTSVQGDKMSMSIDDRSNSLVFYSAGKDYEALLPMIKRLDTMPKQILLEAVIAEVTMTDEFAFGFEFALRKNKVAVSTTGAFGVSDLGGMSLSYVNGLDQLMGQLKNSKSLVNVLSNPSLVVRDGVVATISVGNDLPTVSSTTTDPLQNDRTITSVTYRKTGLDFSILPTINAQGLVVMQIEQSISNQVEGSTIEGAPAVFERSISTEVLAENGQTILLGGLISENTTKNNSKTPFLSNIPLLGSLFQAQSDKKEKTELILLITPKVIDDSAQWNYISDEIQKGFNNLKFNQINER
jgi:general secretion pathway protein D